MRKPRRIQTLKQVLKRRGRKHRCHFTRPNRPEQTAITPRTSPSHVPPAPARGTPAAPAPNAIAGLMATHGG